MKKYYLGVLALSVLSLALFIYVAAQGISTKQDTKTLAAAQSSADKLNSYIDANGTIPASLEQAGVKNRPDTITYQKIGTTQYKFCVQYKGSSSLNLGGAGSALTGQYLGASAGPQYNSSTGYDNSYLYISGQYKKGQNCQTITPYLGGVYNFGGGSVVPQGGSSSVSSCLSIPSNLKVSGSLDVASVDTAKKQINFSADNQYVYDNDSGNTVSTITSKKYSDNTIFCNIKDFSPTTVSTIKPGDTITIYMKSAADDTISQADVGSY
jgi:hypothetical protein